MEKTSLFGTERVFMRSCEQWKYREGLWGFCQELGGRIEINFTEWANNVYFHVTRKIEVGNEGAEKNKNKHHKYKPIYLGQRLFIKTLLQHPTSLKWLTKPSSKQTHIPDRIWFTNLYPM